MARIESNITVLSVTPYHVGWCELSSVPCVDSSPIGPQLGLFAKMEFHLAIGLRPW